MLSAVSKHSVNLQYTFYTDRKEEHVFVSQDMFILPLCLFFTLLSVSLNLHIICQLLSGCAKEQCTLAGCQGNLLKF